MIDLFEVLELLTPEERAVQQTVRQFAEQELLPYLADWWEHESTPTRELMRQMGALGLLGPTLPAQYGGAGLSHVAYGLSCYELECADSGIRSMASVQGSLVMYPIFTYGSDEQKQRWLGGLASGELVGCFGLTEPDGGSDPAAMRTTARKVGAEYVLSGAKMWITNSPLADVALVWAKTLEDGQGSQDGPIRGFLVPTDTAGFSAPKIEHKMSLRASLTGEIVLQDCCVPASSLLPLAAGLKAPLACLTQARYGIAWGAMGALESVLHSSIDYAKTRHTFAQPIGSRQLVQDKLVNMASAHSQGLLLAWRLGSLFDQGRMTFSQVSMAKRNNVRAALSAARLARELHGANGISLAYPVIRHMLNLETVDTYEGTYDIHTLIVGRDLTGLSALG